MNQGNPNKVNAIVDEIVENNNVFKLKSPIEQDKEKDSIAQSINSALSVLNEVGKELVLQELSVDPDEKFKGFIDSVGNVDISGLSQMTATIVKEKIIEAEKEGIDLRQGRPAFKDTTKSILVGGVLTVAVINEMVKNYDNLSKDERYSLLNHYSELSNDQKDKINQAQKDAAQKNLEKWKAILESEDSTQQEKEEAKKHIETLEKWKKIREGAAKRRNIRSKLRNNKNLTDEERDYYISYLRTRIKSNCTEKQKRTYLKILLKDFPEDAKKIISELHISIEINQNLDNEDIIEEFNRIEDEQEADDVLKFQKAIDASEEKLQEQSNKRLNEFFLEIPKDKQIYSLNEFTILQESDKRKYLYENSENYRKSIQIDKIEKGNAQFKEKVNQKVQQLPNKLTKEGFSQEEIKEALKNYTNLIKEFDEEVIDSIKDKDNNELKEWLKELFDDEEEFPVSENVKKILQQLAQNDFEGHLQQILTSPELLQETFLPTLENEIQKLDEKQITDSELEQAKNTEKIKEEFLDASGAIESQKQQESTKLDSPNIPTTPEEHIQESVTSYEQEALEEASQNMAIVEQDNSFIGKIKRVFANMKDMKNKDNSKGFFARLGASIQTVFGNKKDEFDEKQDENITSSTTQRKEQTREGSKQTNYLTQHFDINEKQAVQDLKKKQDAKDKDSQLSQDDQEFGNL